LNRIFIRYLVITIEALTSPHFLQLSLFDIIDISDYLF
jgi:hypothetical protein